MGKRDTPIEDDAELWARVAETATPLKPLKKNRVARVAARARPAPPPKAKAPPTKASAATTKLDTKPPAAQAPKSHGLDRQMARKLGSGRVAVEARLDLHGMRQRDAHAALRKFLKWARSKDYRHVLVITGKGAGPEQSVSFYDEERRGVLRQAVPHWLSHGDLAPLIVSYSEAPRRLGGEGALYVRLRKAR